MVTDVHIGPIPEWLDWSPDENIIGDCSLSRGVRIVLDMDTETVESVVERIHWVFLHEMIHVMGVEKEKEVHRIEQRMWAHLGLLPRRKKVSNSHEQ